MTLLSLKLMEWLCPLFYYILYWLFEEGSCVWEITQWGLLHDIYVLVQKQHQVSSYAFGASPVACQQDLDCCCSIINPLWYLFKSSRATVSSEQCLPNKQADWDLGLNLALYHQVTPANWTKTHYCAPQRKETSERHLESQIQHW